MSEPTRRDMLKASLATVVSAVVGAAVHGEAADAKPNILWLVSEDNNPFIGAYGDALAHTPNIDALAKRGLLYRNVYCPAPVCAPTRFGILTGVHPESCAPANQMRAVADLPAVIRTYPEYLREAGYYCTNNAKTDYNCTADGATLFDESSPTAHYRNRPAGKPFFAVFNHERTHESSLLPMPPARGAAPSAAGAAAGLAAPTGEAGIEVTGMGPAPRSGAVKPADVRVPAYLPDTPDIREDRSRYYNAMALMDAQLGVKLKELDDAGLADDTIVFYYSDNGGILPRSKRYCTDDGLRCAMVVALPKKWAHLSPVPMGSVVEGPVSYVDLAPTLLSIAGIATPAQMQGTAFLGPHAKSRGPYAFAMRDRMDERYDFVRAAMDGRYHYVRNYLPHRVFQHQAYEWQAKGYQSWEREFRAGRLNEVQARFFKGPRVFEEFYDLQSDRDGVKNLVADPAQAARVALMRKALDDHMVAVNDNGFIPEGMAPEGYLPSRVKDAYPLARLMALGAQAASRDKANLQAFVALLADPNAVVRHWAAQGLLMLGADAAPAKPRLVSMMTGDAAPQNRVVAAEAVATIGTSPEAVTVLTQLLDGQDPWPVKLQALNALTYIGDQAKPALPSIKAAAMGQQEYLRNAGRYLAAVLEGRYDPSYPVFVWGPSPL